jgi:hypothetical protein
MMLIEVLSLRHRVRRFLLCSVTKLFGLSNADPPHPGNIVPTTRVEGRRQGDDTRMYKLQQVIRITIVSSEG